MSVYIAKRVLQNENLSESRQNEKLYLFYTYDRNDLLEYLL